MIELYRMGFIFLLCLTLVGGFLVASYTQRIVIVLFCVLFCLSSLLSAKGQSVFESCLEISGCLFHHRSYPLNLPGLYALCIIIPALSFACAVVELNTRLCLLFPYLYSAELLAN